jgi:3-hydroxyisobutyrate dehydrogenase-like beta-hydroxyacid dehydrogenase
VALISFIGFGELGVALAERLGASGANEMRAWIRDRSDRAADDALSQRVASAGVERRRSLEETVAGADAVLSVVSGSASRRVAERSAEFLDRGTLYVDLTTTAMADKEAGARAVQGAGGNYVDAAVLGAAAVASAKLSIVASGNGAREWRELSRCEGLSTEVLDGPAGCATQLKLIRSAYMKGRDALVVETLLAARRIGLEDRLIASIEGAGERVPFSDLADRVLRSLALHAGRRAKELGDSADALLDVGVDPRLARAGADVLRRVADAGLHEEFGGERPESGALVLALLDERMADEGEGRVNRATDAPGSEPRRE